MSLELTGEQKKVLFLPPENPVQIKGVAGSGKTTVSIYRARHLLHTYSDLFQATNVAVFTFNKNLARYMFSILRDVFHDAPPIKVMNFHKWAYDFLSHHGYWRTHKVAVESETKAFVARAMAQAGPQHRGAPILRKKAEFFAEEISWMKGKGLASLDQYLATKRVGRGGADRVTQADKAVIWSVFECYEGVLSGAGCIDFDDFARISLQMIEKNTSFTPPFSHVIVDEAQDLSKLQVRTIAKLVSPVTNSITIIADAAQRIYKSGFSWSEVGINVRGARTVELRNNYRNTRQIAEAAASLIRHDPNPEEFTQPVHPVRNGEPPKLVYCRNWDDQVSVVVEKLRRLDLARTSVVILHRLRGSLRSWEDALAKNHIHALSLHSKDNMDLTDPGVYLCTMSAIKGLEYDHVIVTSLNDEIIPYPDGFAEADDEDHICTERRLLYTAMTVSGRPSRYLSQIDQGLLLVEDRRHG